jgi:hypothetical protein
MAPNRAALREWSLRIIPMVIVIFLVFGSLASLSSFTTPKNPVVGWIEEGQAYFNQEYTISFTSDMACDWSFEGVDWLSSASWMNNTYSMAISGSAEELGSFSVNVTATKHDNPERSTQLSVPINVIETESWGYIETFNGVKTGTHGNATFANIAVKKSVNTESVVLDGFMWIMSRGIDSDVEDLVYEPPLPSSMKGWNLSYEAYSPKDREAFAHGSSVGKFGLRSYLFNDSDGRLAGVELSFGSPKESISLYNTSNGNWTKIAEDILPSFTNESLYEGFKPDRYVVSYECTMAGECRITIWHTKCGVIFSGNVSIAGPLLFSPKLGIYSDVDPFVDVASAWVVDNIAFRSATSRYPIIGPEFEYVYEDKPTWITVSDASGNAITDAGVSIEGRYAIFNSSSKKYESTLLHKPDWSESINYTVTVDGMKIRDSVKVTFMCQNIGSVKIEQWWNGWDWATVLGLDDATAASSAVSSFYRYQHPTTGYLIDVSGDSGDILATQSEIGLHNPHDYSKMPVMFWDEAVAAASSGHSKLQERYTFASRWDDPSYVGRGDMFISMANPGNSASFQLMYAEYLSGTRIDGISSNPVPTSKSAGNSSLIGSWWVPEPGQWVVQEGVAWTPHDRIDMMDADRAIRTEGGDTEYGQWGRMFYVAERHGLLRIYTHQKNLSSSNSAAKFLDWVDDYKTNYSLENWKATDGEAASYVYGILSTDIHLDGRSSDAYTTTLEVSRKDPVEAGYWRVPITISMKVSGMSGQLADIVIEEGDHVLMASDGSLSNLSGKRIMDVGYDIRGDKIYVSYFWNESSILKFSFMKAGASSSALQLAHLALTSIEMEQRLSLSPPQRDELDMRCFGFGAGFLACPIWTTRPE